MTLNNSVPNAQAVPTVVGLLMLFHLNCTDFSRHFTEIIVVFFPIIYYNKSTGSQMEISIHFTRNSRCKKNCRIIDLNFLLISSNIILH